MWKNIVKTTLVSAALAVTFGCAAAKNLAGEAGVDAKDIKAAEGAAKDAAEDAPKNIPQLAAYKGFTQLTAMLGKSGLDKTLEGEGPFTVFAPTDAAFEKIAAYDKAQLMGDAGADKLKALLTYHVVAGKLTAADLAKVTSVKTVNGAELAVVAKDGKVTVGGANVVTADVEATNGVVHAIDAVLTPPAK